MRNLLAKVTLVAALLLGGLLPVEAQNTRQQNTQINAATFSNCSNQCITGPMVKTYNDLVNAAVGYLNDLNLWTGFNVFSQSPALPGTGFAYANGAGNPVTYKTSTVPNPSSVTLGGVLSDSLVAHQWIAWIDTNGLPHQSQPTFGDLGSVPTTIAGYGITDARSRLGGSTDFYVDDINGNNANPCTSNLGGACKTLNGVIARIGAVDIGWFGPKVHVAAPATVYAGAVCVNPWIGEGAVTFEGNTGAPTTVPVAGGASPAFDIENGCNVTLQGFSVSSTLNQSVQAIKGARIFMSAMDEGAAAPGGTVNFATRQGAYLEINDGVGPTTVHTGVGGSAAAILGQASHTGELRINCSSACISFSADTTFSQELFLMDGGDVIGTPSASFALNGHTILGNQYLGLDHSNMQWNGLAPPANASIPGTSCTGITRYGASGVGPGFTTLGSSDCNGSILIIAGGQQGIDFTKQDGVTTTFIIDGNGNPSFPLHALPLPSGGTGATTAPGVRTTTEQGVTFRNILTASNSATLADTTSFSSEFDDYELIFDNVVPATNAVGIELQVHSAGSFSAAGYLNLAGGVTTYVDLIGGAATTLANTTSLGFSGRVTLHNVNSSNDKLVDGVGVFYNGTLPASPTMRGIWGTTAVVDGFQVLMTSGNITSGSIKVYGLRNAL